MTPKAINFFSPWKWDSVKDKDAGETLFEMFKLTAKHFNYTPTEDDYDIIEESILMNLGFGNMKPLNELEIEDLFRQML